MNNVYSVYVEQHHHVDRNEEKDEDGKDVEKKIEVLGMAGLVSKSAIFCYIQK